MQKHGCIEAAQTLLVLLSPAETQNKLEGATHTCRNFFLNRWLIYFIFRNTEQIFSGKIILEFQKRFDSFYLFTRPSLAWSDRSMNSCTYSHEASLLYEVIGTFVMLQLIQCKSQPSKQTKQFKVKVNEDKLWCWCNPLVFTPRCSSPPLRAATRGPTGSVDVRSNLADHPTKSCVWLRDAWGVCFHGNRHCPRSSHRSAEGPTYSRSESTGKEKHPPIIDYQQLPYRNCCCIIYHQHQHLTQNVDAAPFCRVFCNIILHLKIGWWNRKHMNFKQCINELKKHCFPQLP